MAAATSPATGRTYGVRRICAIWGVAQSSFYDARCQEGRPHQSHVGRLGPKPALGDAELLAAIRRDRRARRGPARDTARSGPGCE